MRLHYASLTVRPRSVINPRRRSGPTPGEVRLRRFDGSSGGRKRGVKGGPRGVPRQERPGKNCALVRRVLGDFQLSQLAGTGRSDLLSATSALQGAESRKLVMRQREGCSEPVRRVVLTNLPRTASLVANPRLSRISLHPPLLPHQSSGGKRRPDSSRCLDGRDGE